MAGALTGRRILVTRAARPHDPLADDLARLGATVLWLPTVRIAPPADPGAVDAAVMAWRDGRYDWVVLTSANAVPPLAEAAARLGAGRMDDRAADAGRHGRQARICAVGPATAAAIERAGWRVDRQPATATAHDLVAALGAVAGQHILFAHGDLAGPTVQAGLEAGGAVVDTVVAYRTVAAEIDPDRLAEIGDLDVAAFASGSAVRGLAAALGDRLAPALAGARIACIGPATAAAARECGLAVDIVPSQHTARDLVAAIVSDLEHAS
ncbi:uroporphyrinogen III synthase [bacterium]|nr:MAG: uroporphyrinogen III synthase [bacterium]